MVTPPGPWTVKIQKLFFFGGGGGRVQIGGGGGGRVVRGGGQVGCERRIEVFCENSKKSFFGGGVGGGGGEWDRVGGSQGRCNREVKFL